MEASAVQIQVSSRSPKLNDVKASQNIENWDYASYYDHTRRRSARSYGAYRRALDQQAFYGCGVLYLDFNDMIRKNFSGKQLDSIEEIRALLEDPLKGNPFVIECPQLSAVYFTPDLSEVCQVGTRVCASFVEEAEDDEELGSYLASDVMTEWESNWTETVKVYHYQSRDYIYDVIEGKRNQQGHLLSRRPNVAGRPWYVLIPGRLTSETSPAEAFLPLVGALYPLVQTKNILETLVNSGALQTGRNMYQEVADGRQAQDFMTIMTQPEQAVPVSVFDLSRNPLPKARKGHHWEPVAVPDQSQLIRALENCNQEIERNGFPNVLAPDAGQKASAGYDRALQMEASSRIIGPALANCASAWYELLRLQHDIVKETGISVTLPVHKRAEGKDASVRESITLRPDDLEEYDLLVGFDSAPASQKFTERESDLRLFSAGLKSRQTLMATLSDDPVAEEVRIAGDQMDMIVNQQALVALQQVLALYTPEFVQQALTESGVGPPPQPPMERPPEGSVVPGVGSPVGAVEQPQNGVPPSFGMVPEQVAQ